MQPKTLGVHAGYVAELASGDFQKSLYAGAGWGFEAGLGLDGSGDALGEGSACGERHVEAAGEKAFENLEVGYRELGDAVMGQ